ncbi:MAG TPA: GAF domain-containing protein [Phototrophicaceae bacterium]|nr:GAF domain-containing protein [Phototrophicaceae bacterium]
MPNADPAVLADPNRLAELLRLSLLDSPADPAFDRLTRLAARILDAPISTVTLVDDHRQFFKSQVGLGEPWASKRETPLEYLYSQHVVATQAPLIVADTRNHPLLYDNPSTLKEGLIAYAGIPLVTSGGKAVGSFCVIDKKPRVWTAEEIQILTDLSESVMTEIELRSELDARKDMEDALRKSEQRLQAVITNVPVVVYMTNREGIIQMSEGRGLTDINSAPNRYNGHSIFEIFPGEDIGRAIRRGLAGENVVTELEQETSVGNLHYEIRISPLRGTNDELIGAIGVAFDITERIWVEETLESTIERLTLLRRIDVELSESLDFRSVLTIAMDTALRASGAEHGFIGLLEGDNLRLVHTAGSYKEGSVWQPPHGVVHRALQTHEPQLVLDDDPEFVHDIPGVRAQMAIPLIHRDRLLGILNLKTRFPELFTPEAFDFLSLIAGHITVALDNAQLYQLSQQQLEELHQLYMRVSDLEQLKTDMIRIAAHDLRNPLGIVMGYAQMLIADGGEPLTDDQHMFVEAIEVASGRMSKIVNDILSLQRVEASQSNNDCEQADLNDLVRDIFSTNQVRARNKHQNIRLSLPEAAVLVCVDVPQLREALDNLISNAVKYTPDGGSVRVCVQIKDRRAVFEVKDSGFGIPEDQQGRLFQPFFRASNAKASAIEGTGLGLHLVKNIVERHGGTMHFQSELGRGSLFGFDLPVES